MAILLRRLRTIVVPPLFAVTILLLWGTSLLVPAEDRLDCLRSIPLNLLSRRHNFLTIEQHGGGGAAAAAVQQDHEIPLLEQHKNVTQMSSQEIAFQDAQELMKFLRSGVPIDEADMQSGAKSKQDSSLGEAPTDSSQCDGRRVFIYDLPPRFNQDLVRQCHGLLPWMNLCSYMSNSGMGALQDNDDVLVPKGSWFKTHQYALELVFHARMREHACRVHNSSAADVFYVPYYGGLDVIRWNFVTNVSNDQRDALGRELIDFLVRQDSWSRSQGKDHLLVLGKISWDFRRLHDEDSWGSNLLIQPEMQRMTKLLIERQPWHPNDVGVPHPTYFHPRSDREVKIWQSRVLGASRKSLVSFAGQPRPEQAGSIRGELIRQCLESRGNECRLLDCGQGACYGPGATIALFMSSDFCLQPSGDSPTRRSVFDSLLSGCIPVFFDPFTAYLQYPWHLPADSAAYSVFIPEESLRPQNGGAVNVMDVLRAVPVARRERMRRYIVHKVLPSIVYAQPGSKLVEFDDAFDIALRNVIRRMASKVEY